MNRQAVAECAANTYMDATSFNSLRPEAKFKDRDSAGRELAAAIGSHISGESVVVAIANGGVPVAARIATTFSLKLYVQLAKKIEWLHWPGYGLGAIGSDGTPELNQANIVNAEVPSDDIQDAIVVAQERLAERQRCFSEFAPPPDLSPFTVVVVDDGLASGMTALVAAKALLRQNPHRLLIAVPVASEVHGLPRLKRELQTEVVTVRLTPAPYFWVDEYYTDFTEVSDSIALSILRQDRPK